MKFSRIGYTIIITLLSEIAFAQNCDLIILKDGSEIEAKVLEISPENIGYKKCNFLDGPKYIVVRSDVFLIKYTDGSKELMNDSKEYESTGNNNTGGVIKYSSIEKIPLSKECVKVYRKLTNGKEKVYEVIITKYKKKSFLIEFCDSHSEFYLYYNSINKIENKNGELLYGM